MSQRINHLPKQSQTGYVLVIGLLLLLVLTLVAVTSMQTTTMDFRMSANLARKSDSFQSAESGQELISDLLDEHIFEHGWKASQTDGSSGFTVINTSGTLYEDNGDDEDLTNSADLITDVTYNNPASGNIDGDINADIAVLKTQVIPATGSGSAMLSGYQGLGKSAASGGTHMYFVIHSEGSSAKGSAKTSTQGNYRAVVRN